MEKYSLTIGKRTLTGRKVKTLRAKGVMPANIFGKKTKSQSVQVDRIAFSRIRHKAGETGVVYLSVEGEKEDRPVLITNVQYDPMTGKPVHADFHQISLTEKVEATVPLRIIGEAPAVVQKVGALLTIVDEIEVRALPTQLPEHIEVDVSTLSALDQEIKVKDLPIDRTKVEVLTDEEVVVARIGSLVTKEVEELEKQEAEAKAAAQAAAGAEAAPEAAGAPTEEKAQEAEKVAEPEKKAEGKS